MSAEGNRETLGFQTEVRKLLDLMIHSLYSNKEIFLRELISNASDAADKLRFLALRDPGLYEDDPELRIRVECDREQRTISVSDNGIGMSREEVIAQLGTIAKSGTSEFLAALTGDQARDSHLIGQFGVGFYSAFIVAHRVEVATRRAGAARGEGVRWVSSGESEYTVETMDRPRRGTVVTLHLRDGEDDFLDGGRLRTIIHKYSDHIALPIVMEAEGRDARGEETVNRATALWTRPRKEISESEYQEFYKHVAHDFEDALAHSHNRVEGKVEYVSLLYIPGRAPFDLWDRERRRGLKLYVRRIFIMDDAEQLLPPYLRFVRGIVDSNDLPLNISREILQQDRNIDAIRSGCARKVLELLAGMAEQEPEKYARFWKEFGRVLKEGVIDAPERRDEIARLLRFASTRTEADAQSVSLPEYVARMAEGQGAIYYLTADTPASARGSPHLEALRARNLEVLLLTDPVDEWVVMHLVEFDGKPLRSVVKGDLDLGAGDAGSAASAPTSSQEALIQRLREALHDKVKDVRSSARLTTSAACLVTEEPGLSRHLQRMLEASGQKLPEQKPVLEVNLSHALIGRIEREQDTARVADWAQLLLDQALLGEGAQLPDPAAFVRRLNSLLLNTDSG
ncbi:MAG: molecular chaperone HtpG [Gammaproteobacteria bacterium]|nr:molecular chaperone HtpG [Gammaproteobacteria bacterium]